MKLSNVNGFSKNDIAKKMAIFKMFFVKGNGL